MNHFEKDKLLKDVMNNQDFFNEIIEDSRKSLIEYKKRIDEALNKNNSEDLFDFTHAVKGMAIVIHCPILKSLADNVGKKVVKNDVQNIENLVYELKNEIHVLMNEYLN